MHALLGVLLDARPPGCPAGCVPSWVSCWMHALLGVLLDARPPGCPAGCTPSWVSCWMHALLGVLLDARPPGCPAGCTPSWVSCWMHALLGVLLDACPPSECPAALLLDACTLRWSSVFVFFVGHPQLFFFDNHVRSLHLHGRENYECTCSLSPTCIVFRVSLLASIICMLFPEINQWTEGSKLAHKVLLFLSFFSFRSGGSHKSCG